MGTSEKFAMADYTAGQLNAMVKMMKKQGGKDGPDRFLRGELTLTEPEQPPLLKFIETVSLPATPRFVVADHYKVGEVDGVKIGWIGPNFQKHLLGRVEEVAGAIVLRVHGLTRAGRDSAIIDALSGEYKIALARVWQLLKLQPRGEAEGVLLVNGAVNIFCVSDLWAVYAIWSADCGVWGIEAHSVESPVRWDAGGRVFSCGPLAA